MSIETRPEVSSVRSSSTPLSTHGIHDRRRTPRDTPHGEPSRKRLVSLIESSYREMPGLSLFLDQAARLFGLRESTCRIVLDDLVRAGRLRQALDGQYRLI